MTLRERIAAAIERVADAALRRTEWHEVADRVTIRVIRDYLLALTDELSTIEETGSMFERAKRVLQAAMPLLEAGAKMTPTTIDDQVVAFLKAWLESDQPDMQAFAATYQPAAA